MRIVQGRIVMPGLLAVAVMAGMLSWLARALTVSHWVPVMGPMTPKWPSPKNLRNITTAWPGSMVASTLSTCNMLPLMPPLALTSSTANLTISSCALP